eukprot:4677857-Alexandrium_andersonii.AAC.1
MSASLVGSEMCIRDRCRGAYSAMGCHRPWPPTRCAAIGEVQLGFGGPPVSYTHLTLPTICSV